VTDDPEQDGRVIEVVQRGYMLDGQVVRPAGVKVAALRSS
jgi:molecular chaperone GrpE (heat shock protein)